MNKKNELNFYEKKVINRLPGHVWWKDVELVYLGCNDKVVEFLGFSSKDEFIGKTDYQLWGQKIAAELEKADLRVLKTGKSITLEETIVSCDQKKFTMLTNKSPLYDDKGQTIGIAGTSTDITELKEIQKELEESKIRETHFKAMSSLGGMIAHELRTPLMSIALSARSIKRFFPVLMRAYREYTKITGKQEIREGYLVALDEIADDTEESANYANNIIKTILEGFHYSASKFVKAEAIDLNLTIQKALKSYPLTKEEISLINFSPTESYKVLGSENVIIHVLHNLIKNSLYAIRVAKKGNIKITVNKIMDQTVQIQFRDTAKGISKENREHIFEPFYTTKATDTSIGLGLYFCKVALEKMEAYITCESKEGEYALFTIELKELS